MFELNSPVVDAMIEATSGARGGRAFSRALWVDVEPRTDGYAIVVRGWDKVLAGAKESAAVDAEDRKYHRPALFWNDEAGAPRPYVVATTDDLQSADVAAAQIIDFYASAGGDDAGTFTDRCEALGSAARLLLPAFLSIFGAVPNNEMLAAETRIGSHADYVAGKVRTPKAAKAPKDPAKALARAAAALTAPGMADSLGIDADMLAKIQAILASAKSAQTTAVV